MTRTTINIASVNETVEHMFFEYFKLIFNWVYVAKTMVQMKKILNNSFNPV